MKASFIGNFRDHDVEGLMKISVGIKNYLTKKGFDINTNDVGRDLLNIHSGGIGYASKVAKLNKVKIYSLYTNLKFNVFERAYNLIYHLLFYSKKNKRKLIKILFFNTISGLIPLSYKRKLLSKMDLIIVPTQYLKDTLRLKNCTVIPFGIDTDKFKPGKKETKKIVISFFGSLASQKGFPEVIKCFKILNKEGFFNIGELRMYVSARSELLNKKKLDKHGIKVFGKQDDIVKAYQDSDIVVLPYRNTLSSIGIPLVLLESMSCGKMVITTNLPHIKEVGKDSVLYVKPYSPKQIYEKVLFLLKNKRLISQYGRKARANVVKNYREDKMLKAYEKIYTKYSVDKI